jgi:hypothetical protein
METLSIKEWDDEELLLVVPKDKYFPNKSVSYHLKVYGYGGLGNILWKVLDHKDTYTIDQVVDINANVDQLHDAQHGFRQGRSAIDNIFMLSQTLNARMHNKQTTYLLASRIITSCLAKRHSGQNVPGIGTDDR